MVIFAVASDILKNTAMGLPVVRKIRLKGERTCGEVSAAGMARQFTKFITLLDEISGGFEGKKILEIGPGDNIMPGLAFLADNAASFTVIDRFPGDYGNANALGWYAALEKKLGRPVPPHTDPRIKTINDAAETVGEIGKFDIVCSHAVGEHVSDVAAFARLTHRTLAPNGVAVHVIDFSGHHWHRENDPDLFRRFPDWLWQAMGSNRGLPNRVTPAAFLNHFKNAGMECDFDLQGTHGILVCRKATTVAPVR